MRPTTSATPSVVDRRADVFAVGVMLWELLAVNGCGREAEAHIVHHLAAGTTIPDLPPEPDDRRCWIGSAPGR